MNYFSKNLKWLREKRGLGQAELAKALGVSRDNVASYERNSVPKLEVLMKLVKLFHVTVEQMVEIDFEIAKASPAESIRLKGEDKPEPIPIVSNHEYLQKLVAVQEKYIKSLEEKIAAAPNSISKIE